MNLIFHWQLAIPQLLPSLGLALAFAFLAWGLRAVTLAAAATGVVLTSVLCFACGPAAFVPVLTVFLLTMATTRVGRRKKERLGLAEPRNGRDALQILANVGAASLCAAPLLFTGTARFTLLAGAAAALAEAAGDTVSSELGQAFGGTPRLITTLRRVPPGQDGGLTVPGTLAALAAILIVALSCEWAGMLVPHYFWTVVAAALAGNLLDSLLGATLERRGLLGNNSVNFAGTSSAAALAILAAFLQHFV